MISTKKIGLKKLLTVYIVCIISALCFSISASAVTVFYLHDSHSVGFMNTAAEKAIDAISEEVEYNEELFLTYTTNGTTGYYFNMSFYEDLSDKDKRKVINEFIDALLQHPINSADKQSIYNSLKDLDDRYITAEIGALLNESGGGLLTAISVLKPFTGVVGTVLGVVTIIIIAALFLMTTIDLACMGIPIFQVKENGEKPKFMSSDAYKALKQAQDTNTNVYWLYFKRRFVTYIILFVCIFYLISGQFGDLFADIISLF